MKSNSQKKKIRNGTTRIRQAATINQPVQLMTMVSRREARNAQGLERWFGKEEDASRNPKRIGGKWISSAIRNLMGMKDKYL